MPSEVEDAPGRANLSSVGYTGLFQGLRQNTDEDAPSFFARDCNEGAKGARSKIK